MRAVKKVKDGKVMLYKEDMLIDLTLLLGEDIANRIYELEFERINNKSVHIRQNKEKINEHRIP